jgi:hypothetical protein
MTRNTSSTLPKVELLMKVQYLPKFLDRAREQYGKAVFSWSSQKYSFRRKFTNFFLLRSH